MSIEQDAQRRNRFKRREGWGASGTSLAGWGVAFRRVFNSLAGRRSLAFRWSKMTGLGPSQCGLLGRSHKSFEQATMITALLRSFAATDIFRRWTNLQLSFHTMGSMTPFPRLSRSSKASRRSAWFSRFSDGRSTINAGRDELYIQSEHKNYERAPRQQGLLTRI